MKARISMQTAGHCALNPMGIDTIQRGFPGFDLDMNRIFPGRTDGAATEWVASKLIQEFKGAEMAIDIHASNIFLREIPQVRVNINTIPFRLNKVKRKRRNRRKKQ